MFFGILYSACKSCLPPECGRAIRENERRKSVPTARNKSAKDENEKLKETLEATKDQHLPTQSRKRKSWNKYSQRHKARKIQALQEKVDNLKLG